MAVAVKFNSVDATRETLLIRVKNWEDQESWKDFFNTYSPLVYSVAFKAGLSQAEAEDAVQETMLTVAKQIREFHYNPAIGRFRSWLIHTTQWRVNDQLRKRKRMVEPRTRTKTGDRTATIERVPDPASLDLNKVCEEEWENHIFLLAVDKVKREVSAKHFQIFDLYVLKKWSGNKVAETIGVDRALVHLTKSRMMRLIKKEVETLRSQSI
jgi:RNA polymerase sigma factor (sigma-70 family)